MKHYQQPIVELLLLEEDLLTISDPMMDDILWEDLY